MVALKTPPAEIGWRSPDFELQAVDGEIYDLNKAMGNKGLLVMFICNHCPFVQAIMDKIVRDTNELKELGINTLAIMSNDADAYPEDSFEKMKELSEEKNFSFPYAIDETQIVAKQFGAVCTPDFFGFNSNKELQYRGRLDESGMQDAPDAVRELFEAMKEVAEKGKTAKPQNNSIGCSIKWVD